MESSKRCSIYFISLVFILKYLNITGFHVKKYSTYVTYSMQIKVNYSFIHSYSFIDSFMHSFFPSLFYSFILSHSCSLSLLYWTRLQWTGQGDMVGNPQEKLTKNHYCYLLKPQWELANFHPKKVSINGIISKWIKVNNNH